MTSVVERRPRRLPMKSPSLEPLRHHHEDEEAVKLGGLAGAYKLVQLLIGLIAFGFGPIVAVAYWIEGGSGGLGGSISSYYNSDVRDLFVGMLFALGLMFVTYHFRPVRWKGPAAEANGTGTDDRPYVVNYMVDNWLANAAGAAAVLVALCPTDDTPHAHLPSTTVGKFHVVWGITLFVLLALFAWWRFRMSAGAPSAKKQARNRLYTFCGCVMVGGLALYGVQRWWLTSLPSWLGFVGETIALWGFALSWLLKSGYLRWLADEHT